MALIDFFNHQKEVSADSAHEISAPSDGSRNRDGSFSKEALATNEKVVKVLSDTWEHDFGVKFFTFK
jgi:hypothetical protein